MLPLTLLKAGENHPVLIELKNGDTYNGRLVSCNMFMNICLTDVICTSRDGDRFWKMPECYIRGNTIKYLRIPEEVIDLVPEQEEKELKAQFQRGGRGGGRGSGRYGRGRDDSGRGDNNRGGRGNYTGRNNNRGGNNRGGGGQRGGRASS
eukprot:gene17046-22555_t